MLTTMLFIQKDKKQFYQPLLKQIKDLDWKKTKDLPKVFNNQ